MNRTILITGATGKLGHILVKYFLDSGDRVVAVGRSLDRLKTLRAAYSSEAENLYLLPLDLMAERVGDLLLAGLAELGVEPDCLINNARNIDSLALDDQGKVSPKFFLDEFNLGVVVPYELVMALSSRDNSGLSMVVNIGSIYGVVAPNINLYSNPKLQSPIQYGVTKSALGHLTKELAVRLAKKNIRVNCIAFGGVEGRVDEEFKSRYSTLCPSGRMLNDGDVAGPVDMFLSGATSGVTGHTLLVDGGWTAW